MTQLTPGFKVAKQYFDNKESNNQLNKFANEYQDESNILYVSGKNQKLFLIKNGNIKQEYTISTGKTGFGDQPGSGKTPIGKLTITEKVGAGLRAMMPWITKKKLVDSDKN